MLEFIQQNILATLGIVIPGVLATIIGLCWKNYIKPFFVAIKQHASLVADITFIKRELTPNGGTSLKDTVNCLGETCKRIDASLKVVEHRSKIALEDHQDAFFEIDNKGRFTWANKRFFEVARCPEDNTPLTPDSFFGYSWISNLICEDDRETFIRELESCLEMSRTIEFTTELSDGKRFRLEGNPYKLTHDEHNGYLFSLFDVEVHT